MNTYKSVNEYIKQTPKEFASKVKEMRMLINNLVPKGEETISYGMPTVKLHNKNFLHFACMKGHLGFYPSPSGVKAFESDIEKAGLSYSKGCIRFPYDKPLPVSLITKIVKFRLKEEKN
jgi:uncharacterized protein YdhG (YjbR/CyaY superfamily)